jgi:hypothetical protein
MCAAEFVEQHHRVGWSHVGKRLQRQAAKRAHKIAASGLCRIALCLKLYIRIRISKLTVRVLFD